MTLQEFENTEFYKGMKFKHNGQIYDLLSVDFQKHKFYTRKYGKLIIYDISNCELQ